MVKNILQLRYIGMTSQSEHSEYGFQIENKDESTRQVIMTVAHSCFRTNQLMVQEAPDLCYQKMLGDLLNESVQPIKNRVPVTESDIAHYRATHPNTKSGRRAAWRRPE